MPTISHFFGISIRLYYQDHQPPHFHAIYAEYEAVFAIQTLELLAGEMPKRAKRMVLEWADEHRQALMLNWELAQAFKPLNPIQPLE